MSEVPKRRWFRFNLRTLFVLVTVLGVWLFPQLKWIIERHTALSWVGTQAEYWTDLPVSQGSFLGGHSPWQIRMLGETGVERISVVVKKDAAAAKQKELEQLFPEAAVLVMTPGPGYVGKHSQSDGPGSTR